MMHAEIAGDVAQMLREVGQAATLTIQSGAYDPVAGTAAAASESFAVRAVQMGWTTRLINSALQRVNEIVISDFGRHIRPGCRVSLIVPFGAASWGATPWPGVENAIVHGAEALEVKGGILAWLLAVGDGA